MVNDSTSFDPPLTTHSNPPQFLIISFKLKSEDFKLFKITNLCIKISRFSPQTPTFMYKFPVVVYTL